MKTLDVRMPKKMARLFDGDARYRVAYGGRGSGKTRTFAKMAAIMGYYFQRQGKKGQILCAREHLNSLDESSFTEIKGAIQENEFLDSIYDCGAKFIRTKDKTVEFTFSGLRHNLDSVKSKARILLTWIDEAEQVSEEAWRTLLPTVREEGSEVWVSFNPRDPESPTYQRFVENAPENAKVEMVNWQDNPYFPEVLLQEMEADKIRLKPEVFHHVWEGQPLDFEEGAYYREELIQAERDGRILENINYDRSIPVVTAWDLGMNDSTSIVFAQHVGSEIRIIDFYEHNGVALDHYVQMLRDKSHELGYNYGTVILPHDARVRELGSGKSRIEILNNLGIRDVSIAPQLRVDDGIAAVRMAFNRLYFDKSKTSRLMKCLRHYHAEYLDKAKTFRQRPEHDWSSHAADAFRYLITGHRDTASWGGTDVRRNSERYVA
jgi:phage terminase large subunit